MNLTSASVGGRTPPEESRRRLEDLIRPAQLGVLRFSRLISTDSSLVTPGRWPASTSAWRTHLRSVSAVPMPSFSATAQIAGQSDGYSGRTWRPSGPHAHVAPGDSSLIDVPRLHLPLKKWSLRKHRGGSVPPRVRQRGGRCS